MKRWTQMVVVSAVTGLLCLGGIASAEEADKKPRPIKAKLLIGIEVEHPNGDSLGYIEEVVLDSERERISYAVLSHGGIMGIADKRFAIPFGAFEFNEKSKVLRLPVEKHELEVLKGLNAGEYPQAGDRRFARIAAEYRGRDDAPEREIKSKGKTRQSEKYFTTRRLSKIIGIQVYNPQGTRLGEIKDVVVYENPAASVEYFVLAVDTPGVTLDPKRALIPWKALQLRPQLGTGLLNADRQTLSTIAFEKKWFPDLHDPTFGHRMREIFNLQPIANALKPDPERKSAHASAWYAGSAYNQNFNPKSMITLVCTVQKVEGFQPARNAPLGLALTVRTDDKTYMVHVAPQTFLQEEDVRFRYGDELTIHGSLTQFQNQDIVMATRITRDETDLELPLRDEDGTPLWLSDQVR